MSIQITHVRYGGTKKTEDKIVEHRWKNEQTGNVGQSGKPTMVHWIDVKNGSAFVGAESNRVNVAVVKPQGTKPYLRAHADAEWRNNLVNLPTFERGRTRRCIGRHRA